MKLDRANRGPCPPQEVLRAILHAAAAGACEVAARETRSAYWAVMAVDQRDKATGLLHQAASATVFACAEAKTSSVMPSPRSFE